MEFAKRELLKYGWKEGKGLGRDESGISEALKPKLKFDTSGLGHDNSEQFTYHWWEHLYNKAASNIDIKNGNTLVSRGKLDISTKKLTTIHMQETYGSFVKVSETPCKEPNEKTLFGALLTDDELFKACRGRTAHKGARHGMKLNGKLARIEKQEMFFASQKQSKKDYFKSEVSHIETEKNSFDLNFECSNGENIECDHHNDSHEVVSKMDRKKKRPKVSEINDECSFGTKCPKLNSCTISPELGSKYKVMKKKTKENIDECLVSSLPESCELENHVTGEVIHNKNEFCGDDSRSVNMLQGTDLNSSTICAQPGNKLYFTKKKKKKKKEKSKRDQYKSVVSLTQPYEKDKRTFNETAISTTNNHIESNCEPLFYKKKKKKRIKIE